SGSATIASHPLSLPDALPICCRRAPAPRYTRAVFPLPLRGPMERLRENTMYAARWLLAPIYFGLSAAVLLLAVKFFQELWHLVPDRKSTRLNSSHVKSSYAVC